MPEPPSIHYTTQKPATFNEQHLAQIQITRLQIGAPPICFLPECRRAGRCRGNPQKGRFYLPPCFGHYRQEFRFMLSVSAEPTWISVGGKPEKSAKSGEISGSVRSSGAGA